LADVIGQLQAAQALQTSLKQLLPGADEALQVELRAIRGAFEQTTQALTELQALLAQVLSALQQSGPPKNARTVPESSEINEDVVSEWKEQLLREFGPANEGLVDQEIERLLTSIRNGAPFPGARGVIILQGRLEQRVRRPGVPRLEVLDGNADES